MQKTGLLIGAMVIFLAANMLILSYALRQSQSTHGEVNQLAETDPGSGASGPSLAVDPAKLQAAMDVGQTEYAKCIACHGADGKGMKVGPKLMGPSLVGSKIALGDPDQAALVVLKGIKKETDDYTGIMAPIPLDDNALAGVLTYIRNSFGNKAGMVTPEEAAAARTRFANIPLTISRNDIAKLMTDNPKVAPTAVVLSPAPTSGRVAATSDGAVAAEAVEEPFVPIEGITVVGGRLPNQRPEKAPKLTVAEKDADWYAKATRGLPEPHPESLRFLEDQGNWFNPFTRPGMTGPYDIRNWHTD